jgi:hypothetical protein
VGEEFQVSQWTLDDQEAPYAISLSGGGFVVIWRDWSKDGSLLGVSARLFDSDANPLSGDIQVNTLTQGHQFGPSGVAVGADGDSSFVVIWASMSSSDPDGNNVIFARRFSTEGKPLYH